MEKRLLIGLGFFVIGLYCINFGLNFYTIPYVTDAINNWAIIIAGALVIFGGFRYFKSKKDKS